MSATICPSCLSRSLEDGRCGKCGFTIADYKTPRTAMPLGTVVGNYRIGLMKTNSRQSQVYTAAHNETSAPVIIEEFFPAKIVGRVQDNPEVSLVSDEEEIAQRFQQGCLLIEASAQKRPLKRLECFRANNTVYSVFEPTATMNVSAQCEMMADNPYYFRGPNGMPMMSINLLPIPPMPKQREYNPDQYKKQAPITQPSEEDDRFAGRIITENETRQQKSRLFITLGSIAAVLVLLVGVGFGTGTIQRIINPATPTPPPVVIEETTPPTTPTPAPTPIPQELSADVFQSMLRVIPAEKTGTTLRGIPVEKTEDGKYVAVAGKIARDIDWDVHPEIVNGEVLLSEQEEDGVVRFFFLVQDDGQLYKVEAGTLVTVETTETTKKEVGSNNSEVSDSTNIRQIYTPSDKLAGLGFRLWTVLQNGDKTILEKDTLVVIAKKEDQKEDNWLQPLLDVPLDWSDSMVVVEESSLERQNSYLNEGPEKGTGDDKQEKGKRNKQEDKEKPEDSENNDDNGVPLNSTPGDNGNSSTGADLIFVKNLADGGKDERCFHLNVVPEPETAELTEQEATEVPGTEDEDGDDGVPVEGSEEKPVEEVGGEPVQENNTDTTNSEEPTEQPETDLGTDVPAELPEKIDRTEFLDQMSLISTSAEASNLEGRLVKLIDNKWKGDTLKEDIPSPAKVQMLSDSEEGNVLLVMSPQGSEKNLMRIRLNKLTNPNESVYYYVIVNCEGNPYKVKIGLLNHKGGKDPINTFDHIEEKKQTRLIITLWHKVGEYDAGTRVAFTTPGEGKQWFEELVTKSESMNLVLRDDESVYWISSEIDEQTGKEALQLKMQTSDQTVTLPFNLEVVDSAGTIPAPEEPADGTTKAASDQAGERDGSSQAGQNSTKVRTATHNDPIRSMEDFREKPYGVVGVDVSIRTTDMVTKVTVAESDKPVILSKSPEREEGSKYPVIWNRDNHEAIFPTTGFYVITYYYGTKNEVLGTEGRRVHVIDKPEN